MSESGPESGAASAISRIRGRIRLYAECVGPGCPETLRTAKSLAVSLRKGGELSESLALARDTYERYRSEFPSSNPGLQSYALAYATALSARHEQEQAMATEVLRISEARALRSRVIAGLEVSVGPGHYLAKAAHDGDRLAWDLEPQAI